MVNICRVTEELNNLRAVLPVKRNASYDARLIQL
jgi:hypothetical protein